MTFHKFKIMLILENNGKYEGDKLMLTGFRTVRKCLEEPQIHCSAISNDLFEIQTLCKQHHANFTIIQHVVSVLKICKYWIWC